jgi:hypothetical protein
MARVMPGEQNLLQGKVFESEGEAHICVLQKYCAGDSDGKLKSIAWRSLYSSTRARKFSKPEPLLWHGI